MLCNLATLLLLATLIKQINKHFINRSVVILLFRLGHASIVLVDIHTNIS